MTTIRNPFSRPPFTERCPIPPLPWFAGPPLPLPHGPQQAGHPGAGRPDHLHEPHARVAVLPDRLLRLQRQVCPPQKLPPVRHRSPRSRGHCGSSWDWAGGWGKCVGLVALSVAAAAAAAAALCTFQLEDMPPKVPKSRFFKSPTSAPRFTQYGEEEDASVRSTKVM